MLPPALALILLGCPVHDAGRVQAMAAGAEADPRQIDHLVRALASRDEQVWKAAYAALLELGAAAEPAVEREVRQRRAGADRAVLLLGEMGLPDALPVVRQAMEHASLRPFAEEAFSLAEQAIWERIRAGGQVLELCDAYLEWFPAGEHLAEVRHVRAEAAAASALDLLGPRPELAALEGFIDRHGHTAAGRKGRSMLAARLLDEATRAIESGHPRRALEVVARARELDDDLDSRGVEASAHEALGRSLAGAGDVDAAIEQLEQARALGGGSTELLGRLYQRRAAEALDAGRDEDAMLDLARAADADPSLGDAVAEQRRRWAEEMLGELRSSRVAPADVVPALVLAGPSQRSELRDLVMQRLSAGDPGPLAQVVATLARPEAAPFGGEWVDRLLLLALGQADASVDAVLSDPEVLRPLMSPARLWLPRTGAAIDEARRAFRAWEGTVQAALARREQGGDVRGPVPEQALATDEELAELLRQGMEPAQADLPRPRRVQLMRYCLDRIAVVRGLVVADPARLAAGFVGRTHLPTSLGGWARFAGTLPPAEPSRSYPVGLADGSSAVLTAGVVEGSLRLIMTLPGDPHPLPERSVVDALTVLFGTARPLLLGRTDLAEVAVIMGMSGAGAFDQRVRLALDRRSMKSMDWVLVDGEAPFGPEHLGLVLDQEIR